MSCCDTNHCDCCEFRDECELADGINFCEDCKDYNSCELRFCTCDAGHEIECNNGFEIKDTYCYDDDDEDEDFEDDKIAYKYMTEGYFI